MGQGDSRDCCSTNNAPIPFSHRAHRRKCSVDQRVLAFTCASNPPFAPVENDGVAFNSSRRRQIGQRGADIGFGHADADQLFAAYNSWQDALALFLSAEV